MKKIEINEEFDIEMKRFYLPISIKRECSKCGNICEHDLSINYLSYPTINKNNELYFYCDNCDNEFTINSVLRISLDVEDEK